MGLTRCSWILWEPDEFEAVEYYARQKGMPFSEFVRRCAKDRMVDDWNAWRGHWLIRPPEGHPAQPIVRSDHVVTLPPLLMQRLTLALASGGRHDPSGFHDAIKDL